MLRNSVAAAVVVVVVVRTRPRAILLAKITMRKTYSWEHGQTSAYVRAIEKQVLDFPLSWSIFSWHCSFRGSPVFGYATMKMDTNIVCRFDSSRSRASDKSRIQMESPQSLPKFSQLVRVKPNHCNCLFPLHFPSFTHRLFCISNVTHRMINRRQLVAWHGFLRLRNLFGKAQNKIVNQQNTGNLINFVSEKS